MMQTWRRTWRRKRKYGVLLGILGVVALVAISVTGTLAYLTDRDDANNIFTIGQIEIELYSPPPSGALVPGGSEVAAAPTVTNKPTVTTGNNTTPGNPCYLKAEITVDVGNAPLLDSATLGSLLSIQLTPGGSGYYWEPESGAGSPDSSGWLTFDNGKLTLYYQGILGCNDVPSEPIFEAVKLAASGYLEGQTPGFDLDIVITAIQSDYLDATLGIEDAFEQYYTVHP